MSKDVTLWGASYSNVPQIQVPQTGGGTATFTDTSVTTAVESDVTSGKVFIKADGSQATGTNQGGGGSGVIWQDGQGYVHLSDEGDIPLQTKTVTPTTSAQTVMADNGYYALEQVNVNAVATGTAGTPIAAKGTVSNHSVSVTPSVTNTTGYITGSTKTGTAVSVSASELVSGTYNVTSSGTKDVTNYASASVPSGTEGTPTATKGAVSNHSVSVTPSVTNTTGYITGSTKTGTAVTVSASELVSGTKSITSNGTGIDVTNYASVDVSVSGGGSSGLEYETGTWTPSADTADYTILFTGTHTSAPFFYVIIDSEGDYYTEANSNILMRFVCTSLLGIDLYVTGTNIQYATIATQYRGTSTTSFSSNNTTVTTNTSTTISDYATSTGIRAYTNSTSRYWRAGRAYKWIAVWAPTI